MIEVHGGDTSCLPTALGPPVLVRLHVNAWLSVWSVWDPVVGDWLRGRTGRRRAWSLEASARAVVERHGGAVEPCEPVPTLRVVPGPRSRSRARDLRAKARQERRHRDAVQRSERRAKLLGAFIL